MNDSKDKVQNIKENEDKDKDKKDDFSKLFDYKRKTKEEGKKTKRKTCC